MLHAEENNLNEVQHIIENPNSDVDIEQTNENGFTALALAIKN
jgi:hypothetical protein